MADSSSIFSVREITRLREIDSVLEEELSINAPQALLRDLHRPIENFGVNPLEFEKIERPRDAGQADSAETKKVIYTRYTIDMYELVPTRTIYRDSIIERRNALGGAWADAPKFGNQYLPATMTY